MTFEQFEVCTIMRDIPDQEATQGDRCVLLDLMVHPETGIRAWIVEVVSKCEPFKDDRRSNWTPTILEVDLQHA